MMLLILATVFLVGYSTALRIKSPPKIHPDIVLNNPYIKVVGEKLRLPCKVTGNPKPFKIWYKNNQPLSPKDERWKINRNALIIDHLELNDTAVYHCHTQNSLGEKWINYTVEVKKEIKDYTDYEYYDEDDCDVDGPPKFTKDKTIGYWIARSERSPVKLKCSACGYPEPTIKWYKNKQYIDPKVKKAKYKVHGYQLDIESLSIEETGNYTCILENQHGKLNFTYLLEVLMNRVMAPVIVGPTNQTVEAGSDARFECKVLASDLQHHTQWLQHYTVNGSYRDRNGQPHVNIIQQSLPNITQPEVLIIKNVTKEEAGWYTCLISNPMGREYQSAWLTVIVSPSNMRIINATEDGSVYATEGRTIQLNCSVQSGLPEEIITWKTGDSVLNVGGPMSLLYTFIPTRDDNLKYFTCSARNSMAIHPLEQTVQIKVAYPPKVTIEGDDEIEIREGQSLTLICTSDYDLEYVKWIRNNKTEDSALVTTAQNVVYQ